MAPGLLSHTVMPRARGALTLAVLLASCAAPPPPIETLRGDAVEHRAPGPAIATFEVTAYALHGTTAAGTRARPGIVAADPTVLPLGSRVHILDAGAYSGVYRVEDTGRAIRGRRLDVYIANRAEAKRFGRRRLSVEILRSAPSPHADSGVAARSFQSMSTRVSRETAG